jgi:hypothetical protein
MKNSEIYLYLEVIAERLHADSCNHGEGTGNEPEPLNCANCAVNKLLTEINLDDEG